MSSPQLKRVKATLAEALPFALAALVALPGFQVGFVLDDWIHRGVLAGSLSHTSRWELFSFAPGDPERFWRAVENGPFPWFSLPELKVVFFRPLASALANLDVALFGDAALPAHVHSLAWLLLLIAAARRLFQRTVPALALLAMVLFAIDRSHAVPVTWLANRNSVVATAFAAWGLLGHLWWRENGRRWGLALAVVAWAAALCSAEAAVGSLAYVLAYELLGRRQDAWGVRLRALVPVGIVGVAFLGAYWLAGAGTWGGATYLHPLREPGVFLAHAPERLLGLAGGWSSGLPIDLWLTRPEARPVLVALGVVAAVGWPWLWRWLELSREPEAAAVQWLAAGAVLGALPCLAVFPADRLLIGSSLGLVPLLALVLRVAWRRRAKLVLGWLGLALLLASLNSWLLVPHVMGAWRAAVWRAALHPVGLGSLTGKRVVVIDCADFAVGMYPMMALAAAQLPLPEAWVLLSPAARPHRVLRVDERRFQVEIVDGRILDNVFEQIVRADRFPLQVGQVVRLKTLSVRVLELNQGKPSRFEVALDEEPEAYSFVRWNGTDLERVQLPAPGQVLELPKTLDVARRLIGGG